MAELPQLTEAEQEAGRATVEALVLLGVFLEETLATAEALVRQVRGLQRTHDALAQHLADLGAGVEVEGG